MIEFSISLHIYIQDKKVIKRLKTNVFDQRDHLQSTSEDNHVDRKRLFLTF